MKKQINLYQPSCYPIREKATFKQFLLLLGICLSSALILHLFLADQYAEKQSAAQAHKKVLDAKQSELSLLITEVQKKRTPAHKTRELLALQDETAAKQRLLGSLAGIDIGVVVSFSELMRGLSLADTNSVSINSFSVMNGRLNIAGVAKQSDSVPLWLSKIQETDELADITFSQLQILGEAGRFSFQLTNNGKKKSTAKGGVE
ncbi:hypothetical protein [Psychromonas ossibalaenae]|uniref:hypothetical protein n=1 Tax=Psychromonas ossibalaenae TaxID=444922 RepID=UPI00036286B2|nr:hypothetical protein [Psychromonas ossibalaenae]